mgnify:CR=1 FL=1
MKNKRKKMPYRSRKYSARRQLYGKTEKRSLEPSSGGTGTRLKTAKRRFIKTMEAIISKKEEEIK